MKYSKIPERKTFLQERFEILIKKQKNGNASFNELTELDDLVNKYASFREQILEEMQENANPSDDKMIKENIKISAKHRPGILASIKLFIDRLLSSANVYHNLVLL